MREVVGAMGLDGAELLQRKQYIGLDAAAEAVLADLGRRLGHPGQAFLDNFYSRLLAFAPTRALLPDERTVERLRQAQERYFRELLGGCYDLDYALNRVQVGLAHQRVGLAPQWYLGAYAAYLNELLPQMAAVHAGDQDGLLQAIQALLKVAFLDIGLVLKAYFHADRRRIEQLRAQAERIVQAIPVPLALLDAELCIVEANSALAEFTGQPRETLRGMTWQACCGDVELAELVEAVVESRRPLVGDRRLRRLGGAERYLSVSLVEVPLEDGPGYLVALEDLSGEWNLRRTLADAEARQRAIVDHTPDGIITVNGRGEIVGFNQAAEGIFGFNAEAVLGMPVGRLMAPADGAPGSLLRSWLAQGASDAGSPGLCEAVGRRADGSDIPLEVSLGPLELEGETGFVAVVRDISAWRADEGERGRLAQVVEQTADAVMITDARGVVVYVNRAFEEISGWSRDEVIGQTPRVLRSGKQGRAFYNRLWQTIASGQPFTDIFVNRRKDGRLYYEEKTITPLIDRHGAITHYVSTGKDVTERMQVEQRFHYLAHHDALTELPNRALLGERLSQALTRARWQRRNVAVLCVGLDRFRGINESLGHEAGDHLLREVAARLVKSVREGDTVARLGGDEFAVLLADVADINDIGPVADKILEGLARPFTLGAQELYLTASVGAACFPDDGDDPKLLLQNADAAMMRAKEEGTNTCRFYSREMGERARARLSLETRLRGALERDEFELFFQPQLDLRNRRISGVEALIRWSDGDQGLVPPNEFIPLLEETGLIVQVGEWVLQAVAEQYRHWQAEGIAVPRIAVNLSGRQLASHRLVQVVQEILEQSGMPPAALELEITESVIMRDVDRTAAILDDFRALGVRVAVDDFGTGYSSLAYLNRFDIEVLKIDRSFVADVLSDDDSAALAGAIIALGHQLGLEVVAEGVETREQLEFLCRHGCDIAQGYLLAAPRPAGEMAELLGHVRDVAQSCAGLDARKEDRDGPDPAHRR